MTTQNKETQKRVDVVFVGAGPATLGLFCNSVKTNRLNELLMTGDGVAIIEEGLGFGGGYLQHFGINSNTSANGFLKCVYRKKIVNPPSIEQYNLLQDTSVSTANQSKQQNGKQATNGTQKKFKEMENVGLDEGNDSDEDAGPDNSNQYEALPPFRDIYPNSDIVKALKEYGPNVLPLPVVGMFMNFVGNHLLQYIFQVYKRKIFYPSHKVISIQLLASGEILTTTKRKDCIIKRNQANGHTVFFDQETTVTFRSKAIVLSNGGSQNLPIDFYKWFPKMISSKDKVILADHFLRKDVFKSTMKRIKEENLKNIVIIGGSHSGFSCAWMLLNGPASYKHNKNLADKYKDNFPGAQMKYFNNCQDCCTCQPKKQTGCSCQCKCYGFFQYKDWEFDYENDIPKCFEQGSIKILYRDKIKVFYSQVKNAEFDGYTDFKALNFSNKNGYLYSFTGLRGDAKKLYKSAIKGEEKRINLIKADTADLQREHVENADLVIWACGYQTNKITIKDFEGKEVGVSQKIPFTQYDVDGKCRILTSDNGILTKTFGTGIAYPLRTNDGMILPDSIKPNPRADSFSLYLNFVADKILQNVLPKSKLDNKLHKTIRDSKVGRPALHAQNNTRQAVSNVRPQNTINKPQQVRSNTANANQSRQSNVNTKLANPASNNLIKGSMKSIKEDKNESIQDKNTQPSLESSESRSKTQQVSPIKKVSSKIIDEISQSKEDGRNSVLEQSEPLKDLTKTQVVKSTLVINKNKISNLQTGLLSPEKKANIVIIKKSTQDDGQKFRTPSQMSHSRLQKLAQNPQPNLFLPSDYENNNQRAVTESESKKPRGTPIKSLPPYQSPYKRSQLLPANKARILQNLQESSRKQNEQEIQNALAQPNIVPLKIFQMPNFSNNTVAVTHTHTVFQANEQYFSGSHSKTVKNISASEWVSPKKGRVKNKIKVIDPVSYQRSPIKGNDLLKNGKRSLSQSHNQKQTKKLN